MWIFLALLSLPFARAGEIMVVLTSPVLLSVDGRILDNPDGLPQVVAADLAAGSYHVEARNLGGKRFAESTVTIGADEQIRLRYSQKVFAEIGRSTIAGLSASAGAQGVQVQAGVPGAGGMLFSVTVNEGAPPAPAATGLASVSFTGLDPSVYAIAIDGRPLPYVPDMGGWLATDLSMGAHHFQMTRNGADALSTDLVPAAAGMHQICTIKAQSLGYDTGCVMGGRALSRGESTAVISVSTPAPTPEPEAPPAPTPMPEAQLVALVHAVESASFSDDQVSVIRTAAAHNHFTCAQVVRLVKPISFSSSIVESIEAVRPAILDPENAYQLEAALTFSGDKEAVRALFR